LQRRKASSERSPLDCGVIRTAGYQVNEQRTEDGGQKARFPMLDTRYAQDSEWGLEVVSKNSLYVKRVRALRITIMNF
jgi:hypothetical protein